MTGTVLYGTSSALGWDGIDGTYMRYNNAPLAVTVADKFCISIPFHTVLLEEQNNAEFGSKLLPVGSVWMRSGRHPANHFFRGTADILHLCIHDKMLKQFKAELCGHNSEQAAVISIYKENDPIARLVAPIFRDALLQTDSGSPTLICDVATLTAYHLIHTCATSLEASKQRRPTLSAKWLFEVQTYVEANLSTSLNISDLAKIAGIRMTLFTREFKSSTGMTPHQFIIRSRINQAKFLLRNSSAPIATIAKSCGFANQGHLTRTFGRITGATPAMFRRFSSL